MEPWDANPVLSTVRNTTRVCCLLTFLEAAVTPHPRPSFTPSGTPWQMFLYGRFLSALLTALLCPGAGKPRLLHGDAENQLVYFLESRESCSFKNMEKESISPNLTYLCYPSEFWHQGVFQVVCAIWVKPFSLPVFSSCPFAHS